MAIRSLSRVLVRAALLLVLLLLVAVLVAWSLARRSLWRPADEAVAGLGAEATVRLDRWGVPHVAAASAEDALLLQGWLHARDRFFQMELARRAAAGRLAELLGAAALPADLRFRRLDLAGAAARQTAALDGESRRALEAYAAGVNAALEAHGPTGLAPELLLLRGDVEPWRAEDSIGVGLVMQLSLTPALGEELRRAAELRALGAERAARLWGWSDEQAAAWMPPEAAATAGAEAVAKVPSQRGNGSNNWALTGARTRSGKPILANDPHLGVANPSTWYELHLSAPGLEVAGASIPGAPGVMIGHNADVAWGFTVVMLDDQDLFALELDEAGVAERVGGTFVPLGVRTAKVRVRGEAQPREVVLKISRHGPVVRESGGRALALAWTALGDVSPLPAFLALGRSGTVEEGAAAFASTPSPAMNLMLADRAGTIRWQVIGLVPKRGRGAGRLPSPGWDLDWAWQGLQPYEDNPTLSNPQRGFLATANHDLFALEDWPGAPFASEFASAWRALAIREALAARSDWDAASSLALQLDERNGEALHLLRLLRPHLEAVGGAAVARLLEWDGRMAPASREALLWAELLRELGRRVGADEVRGEALRTATGAGELLRLLEGGLDPIWWDDVDTPAVEGPAEIVAAAFAAAERRAAGQSWGARHQVLFEHPLGSVPLLGRLLNHGPYPVPGAPPTINATWYRGQGDSFTVTGLPSLRFVADLGDWDRSLLTLPLGQSGHPLSRLAGDQTADWLAGRAHEMAWSEKAVERAAVATVRLRPRARL